MIITKNTGACDYFFYCSSSRDGYIRGVYPCSLSRGHVGPHLHWDENPANPHCMKRTHKTRSEWLTEETFGKIPIVIEYRAKIAKMREIWLSTGTMPRFEEVTL